MKDARMKGTGNSRYLKSVANFLGLYPTYEDFAAALIEGTLPVDFNGRNQAGWDELGTDLNKANLLKDTTAALYGKTAQAVPDDIFAAIRTLITTAQTTANGRCNIQFGSYVGTGGTEDKSITFSFTPKFFWIYGGYFPNYANPDDRLQNFVNRTWTTSYSASSCELCFACFDLLPTSYPDAPDYGVLYSRNFIGYYQGSSYDTNWTRSPTKRAGNTISFYGIKKNNGTISRDIHVFNHAGSTYYWLAIG